jgi:hypothetical protein
MTSLHVIPDERGGWHVRTDGAEPPLSDHTSATAAERAAQRHARTVGAETILIHDRYTRVHAAPVAGRAARPAHGAGPAPRDDDVC